MEWVTYEVLAVATTALAAALPLVGSAGLAIGRMQGQREERSKHGPRCYGSHGPSHIPQQREGK